MELTKQVQPQWHEIEHGGEKVEFLLRPLTAAQKLSLLGMADGLLGDTMLQTIRFGVADWRGITQNGEPVPFSDKALHSLFENGELHPMLLELAMAISRRSELSDADAKK
jgi:hypothetical protein